MSTTQETLGHHSTSEKHSTSTHNALDQRNNLLNLIPQIRCQETHMLPKEQAITYLVKRLIPLNKNGKKEKKHSKIQSIPNCYV